MNSKTKAKVVSRELLVPFILITSLFSLWGFANDITNPMVAAFKTVMEISNAKAALIQFAFYGGYATMAIPAALYVKKYSYKKGILMGLALYALGALLFYPAAKYEIFEFFLLSLYILTFGLAFLETTANPYILSMGSEETSTRRLNLAQSFNPMGSLLGMFVASNFILTSLQSDVRNESGALVFSTLSEVEKAGIRTHDLAVIRDPYVILGFVVILMFLVIYLFKMPKRKDPDHTIHAKDTFRRLIANPNYREGVIAQVFYVAAQIMCWTFIIQYAENLGVTKAQAQHYNIIAMGIFLASRFISTMLMKYLNSRLLLTVFATGGFIMTLGAIPDCRYARVILSDRHISFYVSYVSYHLWNRPRRRWRRCYTWGCRVGYGHCGRSFNATFTGSYYRFGYSWLASGSKLFLHPTFNLFCHYWHLWVSHANSSSQIILTN